MDAKLDPKEIVLAFLACFPEQRFEEANGFLAPGCVMEFPGARHFTDCRKVPQAGAGYYRRVRKVIARIDTGEATEGTVIHVSGTLSGEWEDGTPFAGIRFLDRLVVQDGRIRSQMVWNDIAITLLERGLQ